MSEAFDRDSWERRWTRVLAEQPDMVAARPPGVHLLGEVDGLPPGRALDAGCGHGAEALWLAGRGWDVTAVDFSATALDLARSTAATLGLDERLEWIEGDLGEWVPEPEGFDLVVSAYVHVAGPVAEMVQRLASGVAAGGTLLLVGHRPVDPETGRPSAAWAQTQVSVDEVLGALDPERWEIVVAEERPRTSGPSGVDAVVRARRQASGSSRRSGSRSR